MASSQSPNRVFFSNFDRSVNDTTTDFTISFDTPIQNAYNFEVVSASFPNLFAPFASYETILYFYHEEFNNGSIAIAIPLSTTLTGGTGESSPPAGRDTYIDGRYFADGTELATFLTDWLTSLSTSWPTEASGLRPFFFTNDNPFEAKTFLVDENATGITFSDLSFAFDDLTANGTLKLTFADSTPSAVRIASVLDFGSLDNTNPLPSRLGFKLGYTNLINEAFGSPIIKIDTTNNIFKFTTTINGVSGVDFPVVVPVNDYTRLGLVGAIRNAVQTSPPRPNRAYFTSLIFALDGSDGLLITLPAGDPTTFSVTFPDTTTATTYGFVALTTTIPAVAGSSILSPNAIPLDGDPISPDDHIAPSTINLIRTSNVFMASSLSSGESMTSAGRKDVLFAVPLSAGIGAVQQYQSSLSGIVINRPPNAIRNLRLTMLDDLFQVLEPLPPNASVNVEIHFAYQEDAKASQLDFRSTNLYA
jgi:hypothetical protein